MRNFALSRTLLYSSPRYTVRAAQAESRSTLQFAQHLHSRRTELERVPVLRPGVDPGGVTYCYDHRPLPKASAAHNAVIIHLVYE